MRSITNNYRQTTFFSENNARVQHLNQHEFILFCLFLIVLFLINLNFVLYTVSETSKIAKFTELNNSTIILTNDNRYYIYLNLNDIYIPPGCGDSLILRVFTEWTYNNRRRRTMHMSKSTSTKRSRMLLASNTTLSPTKIPTNMPSVSPTFTPTDPTYSPSTMPTISPTDPTKTPTEYPTRHPTLEPTKNPTNYPTMEPTIDCSLIVGSFYDPTVTCDHETEHTEYCQNDGDDLRLCGDNSYEYNCDPTNDIYSCSPSDLTGKYGTIDISGLDLDSSSSDNIIVIEGTDELMISLSLLEDKSVVLQCSDSYYMSTCAPWEDYIVNTGDDDDDDSDSDDSGINPGYGSGGSDASAWIWILIILAIFACCGCTTRETYVATVEKRVCQIM